ncbi:ferrous iron transport protein B [Methermicoccus shengliensis]|uniref:Ferrous iron transport protein B n=1 Tax=Methermicoccus shengliensis TaxID=660064 RepID=A0A832RYP7_9EURY|nr:ferrous iron transport protein B [Methermicoccus shengliensis]KUK04113.1 MAG: Ferrous iron transport protein B [Euryarchaeota archaeon 55_53]KUK29957.1 MAG: Ferrous iron transport protein B [Methanosarcinales archeaon 56_1174]MDI3487989.1 ferrous iron transport protein [Methanosarcinales archaeon]MDN5295585.1 ferrous iron transport protein [Methanosarcinales archaeon]HIH70377.1 ferrous iron transport protein B [Methermicoccus shengliensis]
MGWSIFRTSHCHAPPASHAQHSKRLVLVGTPNVGKSMLFNNLTGTYTVVSNYPGTTVEISMGRVSIGDVRFEVIDTPGMYSLAPITDEERVSERVLLVDGADVVLHVVAAPALRRMLPLTLQLLEAGLPLILVLNMMDEAERDGMLIDVDTLEQRLAIPVVPMVSTVGRGMERLLECIASIPEPSPIRIVYGELEPWVERLEGLLKGDYLITRRALALLLLQRDRVAMELVEGTEPDVMPEVERIVEQAEQAFFQPIGYLVGMARHRAADELLRGIVRESASAKVSLAERLDSMLMSPIYGVPILLAVLYFGFYRFVGVFGAGVLVDFLEGTVFGQHINPIFTHWFEANVPYPVVVDLFVGEYGIITQGITYAVALILPIVGLFFLVFSLLEDSGYLPRLSMLVDRVFKRMGLSGRAVIPMVLGFGCDTMATLVTRTLETKREKVIAVLLLSLAVPCSAQLGVVLAILSFSFRALVAWALIVLANFLLIGYLAARLMPGEGPTFFMELPPLRVPKLSNVLTKTYARVQWYFVEVLPLFVLASILIWAGKLVGLFQLGVRAVSYPVSWIGLPPDVATIFFFGFFRRDYGAVELYKFFEGGLMSEAQLVVAAVTLTLFVPCIAQLIVTVRERGTKTALAIAGFIFPFAFLVGFLTHLLLTYTGVFS